MAGKRKPMSRRLSKSVFRKGTKVARKNIPLNPMRGGIRL